MKSRTLTNIAMCSIFGLLLALPILTTSANGTERPNIVVIMVDDMGHSDLGCYGSEIETPRLAALPWQRLRFSAKDRAELENLADEDPQR